MTTSLFHIGELLSGRARLMPNRVAARDNQRTLTWAQWNERASRLANALAGLGLTKGDRVAVLAFNRVEWVEIYAAVAKAGLVAVPVNFRLTSSEAAYILGNAEARVCIVETALKPALDGIPPKTLIDDFKVVVIDDGAEQARGDNTVSYESLIAKGAPTEPVTVVTADDPWCLMYTSGTTGNPKGAIRSHRGMAMLGLMTAIELKLHVDDDALLVMPMCHANSLNFFTAFTYCGARISVFDKPSFEPELLLRCFEQFGCTFTSLVPTQFRMLLDLPASGRGVSSYDSVEKLMISSAPARADAKREIMEMFPNSGLYELYGSTEAGWVTMLHPKDQFSKLGSVGREVVGSLPIRLLDDDDREVPDGEPGELFSSSPYSFDGYWRRPDATKEAMRGNYLSVGDVAIRDEDGFIHLVDRKKNIIITGGENVYPSEVENLLATHLAVKDVAVVGRPDAKWGEAVAAAVVLKEGQACDAVTLMDWCRDRLAGFKRPRSIVFLTDDEMPRNATGKILHRELRDLMVTREPD